MRRITKSYILHQADEKIETTRRMCLPWLSRQSGDEATTGGKPQQAIPTHLDIHSPRIALCNASHMPHMSAYEMRPGFACDRSM